MSRKRSKISPRKSQSLFTHTAMRVHPRNTMDSAPMRGGIRL